MLSAAILRPIRAIHDSDPRLLDLVVLYLTVKVGLVVVALLGSRLLPFNWPLYTTNLVLDL